MQKRLWTPTLVLAASVLATAQQTRVPGIDELIALERLGGLALSPDGTRVAYTVTSTDWEENAYETEITWPGQTAARRCS